MTARRSRPEGDRSDEETDQTPGCTSWTWAVLVGAFIIQLVVPSVLACYGVLLVRLVEGDYLTLKAAFWTPVVYVTSWSIAEPFCKKGVDGYNGRSKYMVIIGVLVVCGGVATSSLLDSSYLMAFSYGMLGGLGTSLIMCQIEGLNESHFSSRIGLTQGVRYVSCAIGQFIMPLLMYGFVTSFGTHGSALLLAAVVLHALIGAMLFFPPPKLRPDSCSRSRPRTYTIVKHPDSVELGALLENGSIEPISSPLLPTQDRNWKNPANELDSPVHLQDDSSAKCSGIYLLNRRKNHFGVDILPRIPEENEDAENSDDESSIPLRKRKSLGREVLTVRVENLPNPSIYSDSVLVLERNPSASYEGDLSDNEAECCTGSDIEVGMNEATALHDSSQVPENHLTDKVLLPRSSRPTVFKYATPNYPLEDARHNISPVFSVELISSISVARDDLSQIEDGSVFDMKHRPAPRKCCFTCPSGFRECAVIQQMYKLGDAARFSVLETIRLPYILSSLVLRVTTKLCPMGFTSLVPILTRRSVKGSSYEEAAFAVAVSGFAWLCFLISMPWFLGMTPHRRKYLFSVGCFVSATAFYLLSNTTSSNQITLNCVIYGLGHGATLATGNTVVQEALGSWALTRVSGLLEAVTGVIVILASTVMCSLLGSPNGISHCLNLLAGLEVVAGVVWLVKPLVEKFKSRRPIAHDWIPGSDFLTPA